MKRWVFSLVEKLHLLIFKESISEETRSFTTNVGYIGISTAVAVVFLFVVNILAGRLLGPSQYGQYLLVISLSNFFIIPMLLGLHTSVIKHLSPGEDKERIISGAVVGSTILAALSSLVFIAVGRYLAPLIGIDQSLYLWTVAFSALLTFRLLTDAIVRARHEYRYISVMEIVQTMTIFAVFIALIWVFRHFWVPVAAMMTAYAVYIGMGWRKVRGFVKSFDRQVFVTLLHFGAFATIGSLSGFVLNNIDRIMINKMVGPAAVGIYGAYFSASSSIPMQLQNVFMTVFAPTAAKLGDYTGLFRKLLGLYRYVVIPLLIFAALTTTVIVLLFGKEYPLEWSLVTYFAVNVVVFIIGNILWWLIGLSSLGGIKFTSSRALVIAGINILLNLLLIPRFGIAGAIWATIISQGILLILALRYLGRLETRKQQNNG